MKIKRLTSEEWRDFTSIRLQSLRNEPDAFCPSSDEFSRSDEEWRKMLEQKDFAAFGLYDSETIVGLTGVVRDRNDSSGETGLFVMSYITPSYRRKGYSSMFYKERIDWSKKSGFFRRLVVGHRKQNEISKKAILSNGFTYTHEVDHTLSCGSLDTVCYYELLI